MMCKEVHCLSVRGWHPFMVIEIKQRLLEQKIKQMIAYPPVDPNRENKMRRVM